MEEIKFTIPGDPVGYLRMTQGQVKLLRIPRARLRPGNAGLIVDRIRKYLDYKEEIRYRCPIKNLNEVYHERARMDVTMYFKNRKHPDPDNVFKAVADAIFKNDNRLFGTFAFYFDRDCPRVEVKISLDEGGKT